MAKKWTETKATIVKHDKGTSIGRGNIKLSSMNKHKRRGYKKYRGQGK